MRQEILEKLNNLSDEKYKKFHSKLCPGTENIIGVRVPVLRNYAKELAKEHNIDELLNTIGNEYYEEVMIQGMIIGMAKDDLDIQLKRIEKFVPKIDNWAVCDTFVCGLKFVKKYPDEVWNFIKKYLNSNNEFELRFAIVMILSYYIDKKYLHEIFKIFDKIKCDRFYVKMAIAWAISVCIVKYYDETINYLRTTKIDDFTFNKSIQKSIESYRISDSKKEELRKMRR